MTLKCLLFTILQFELQTLTLESIAGVTYMDHFDFEERYRDVNECNPFHWHPLHMPEDCADMYEKLIRSRIASESPVRVVRTREKTKDSKGSRRRRPQEEEQMENAYSLDNMKTEYWFPDSFQLPYLMYEVASHEIHEQLPESPYAKMMEMIKKDVMKDPSAPSVQVLPGLGPVAVYRQSISSKTQDMIKQMAKAYAKAGQETYVDYAPFFPTAYPAPHSNPENNKGQIKNKIKVNTKNEKFFQKKIENGGVITIIKSKHSPHSDKTN